MKKKAKRKLFLERQSQEEKENYPIKKVAQWLNWCGGIIAAWTIFYPEPYKLVISCCFLAMIAILVSVNYKGKVRIMDDTTKFPSISFGFMFLCLAIFLRGSLDFNLLEYSNVLTISLFLSIVLSLVIALVSKEFDFSVIQTYSLLLVLLFFLFLSSFGSIIIFNCISDSSKPELIKTKIIGKKESHGKTTKYHVRLEPWSSKYPDIEYKVSKEVFYNVYENKTVTVFVKKGSFSIPCFEVEY